MVVAALAVIFVEGIDADREQVRSRIVLRYLSEASSDAQANYRQGGQKLGKSGSALAIYFRHKRKIKARPLLSLRYFGAYKSSLKARRTFDYRSKERFRNT
jgi:hypothetical protein